MAHRRKTLVFQCPVKESGRLRVLPDFRQILFCRILRDVPVVVDKTEETKDFSAVRPELVPLPGGNRQEISLFDSIDLIAQKDMAFSFEIMTACMCL